MFEILHRTHADPWDRYSCSQSSCEEQALGSSGGTSLDIKDLYVGEDVSYDGGRSHRFNGAGQHVQAECSEVHQRHLLLLLRREPLSQNPPIHREVPQRLGHIPV